MGFQWVSALPPCSSTQGAALMPHHSQPRSRVAWWKAMGRVFPPTGPKMYSTLSGPSELFKHFNFPSIEHWHHVVWDQVEKVPFTEMTVNQWEELWSSPRQWCGACVYSDTTDVPWQGVGDVALPRDFSEPAFRPCPIPYWQGTDFSGVTPGTRAPHQFFATTSTSTQPS